MSRYINILSIALVLAPRMVAAQDEPSWPGASQEQRNDWAERQREEYYAKEADRAEAQKREDDFRAGLESAPSYDEGSSDGYDGDGMMSTILGFAMIAVVVALVVSAFEEEPSVQPPSPPEPQVASTRAAAPAGTEPTQEPVHHDTGLRPAALPRGYDDAAQQKAAEVLLAMLAISSVLALLGIASVWRLFSKAGRAGWTVLVPFYNWWKFLELGGVPGWLIFIPFVNAFATWFLAPLGIAQRFGRSTMFGLGLVFAGVIFYPLLAFGSATYVADSSKRPRSIQP